MFCVGVPYQLSFIPEDDACDAVYVKERQNLFEVTRGSEWLFRNS